MELMPYQLLSATYHCCLYKHRRQDEGSHPRAADRCPFVPRHSLSQVTCFMQLGMLWYHTRMRYLSHYSNIIMRVMAFQITSISMVCLTICSGADQRKNQSATSLAFVRGIQRWPVNSLHKGPVTRKMFPFNDVIMHLEKIMAYCLFDTTALPEWMLI